VFSHFHKGDFERAVSLKDDFLREMEQEPQVTTSVMCLLCAASWSLWFLGRWDDAVKQAEQALRFAEKSIVPEHISLATWTLSEPYCAKGDLDRAIHYGEIAVEGINAPYYKAIAQVPLGWALCRAGKTSRGLDLMTALFQMGKSDQWNVYECYSGAWLAEGYLLAGEYEKASETSERIIELATHMGAKPWLAWCHRILGEVALRTEENQAAPHFEKAISIFKEIKAENELALAYSGMGRYHKQQGETEQAREYLTKALDIFERLGTLIEPDKVRRELAELPSSA
jgi:tetratricopeptide (TPR) repeat protein